MFARLGCLFILVPLLELALLIQMGRWVGLVPTILLVATTGVVGAWLARREGVRTMVRFQTELGGGKLPGDALMDGASILVGGAFLMTPGVLTDVVGFALLIPPSRRRIQAWVRRRLRRSIEEGRTQVSFFRMDGTGGVGGMGGFPGMGGQVPDRDRDRDPDGDDHDEGDDGPPAPPRPGEIVQ